MSSDQQLFGPVALIAVGLLDVAQELERGALVWLDLQEDPLLVEGADLASEGALAGVAEDVDEAAHADAVVLVVEERGLSASSRAVELLRQCGQLDVVDLVVRVQDSHETGEHLKDEADRLDARDVVADQVSSRVTRLALLVDDEVVHLDVLHLFLLGLEVAEHDLELGVDAIHGDVGRLVAEAGDAAGTPRVLAGDHPHLLADLEVLLQVFAEDLESDGHLVKGLHPDRLGSLGGFLRDLDDQALDPLVLATDQLDAIALLEPLEEVEVSADLHEGLITEQVPLIFVAHVLLHAAIAFPSQELKLGHFLKARVDLGGLQAIDSQGQVEQPVSEEVLLPSVEALVECLVLLLLAVFLGEGGVEVALLGSNEGVELGVLLGHKLEVSLAVLPLDLLHPRDDSD